MGSDGEEANGQNGHNGEMDPPSGGEVLDGKGGAVEMDSPSGGEVAVSDAADDLEMDSSAAVVS